MSRQRLYQVIFESDTRGGRQFDIALMGLIVLSLVIVVLDSIESVAARFPLTLSALEWTITLLFTIEYAARLYCSPQRLRYALSFFGVIDLLAILPTYLALFFPELHALLDVRVLRLLRIFRVLRLTLYLAEFRFLGEALAASRRKILVFLMTVSMVVLVMGTVMYVVEGPRNGFSSIPTGVYWAITTMTTVGFGDITPKTDLGRVIASLMMLMGWGVLAVPTGIVTAEMVSSRTHGAFTAHTCPACGATDLAAGDRFCRHCGKAQEQPAHEHPPASAASPRRQT